jgi:hypothetical protein
LWRAGVSGIGNSVATSSFFALFPDRDKSLQTPFGILQLNFADRNIRGAQSVLSTQTFAVAIIDLSRRV